MDYKKYAVGLDGTVDYPAYELQRDFPREEYDLRVRRARELMTRQGLDALVITSSHVGHWFTSATEPHSWHDRIPSRSVWYILTPDSDYLYMPPTNNHQFSSARRLIWVTHIREIVERTEWPCVEIWGIQQIPPIFAELGLLRARLGFELGDAMTLGISVNAFMQLQTMMPEAKFVDASGVLRRLMAIQTPFEVQVVRQACQAGVWIHKQVTSILRSRMTEREFCDRLAKTFYQHHGKEYSYQAVGSWDVRNPESGDYNLYHAVVTDRVFRRGDQVCRGTSGVSYRSYEGDVDRIWYLGRPPEAVKTWYRIAWECNRAMAEQIKPGARCSDVYAASARIEERYGLQKGRSGRRGHGLRNTGGLSVHPDNHTVLEPGMIISVEPMFGNRFGFYDLEDQYVVTETGRDCLHEPAPEEMPVIDD